MTRSVFAALVLAAASFAAAPAGFAAPIAADFDQGVDARGVLEELRQRRPDSRDDGWARPQYRRTERDCAVVSFRKQDPLTSERVTLESRQYEERCYPSGPNGGRNCHEEWVWTERRHVRVEIQGRGEMLPWEEDTFELCLDGRWLSARVPDASHEYSLAERGDTIIARAGRKVASLPDPVGIVAESFAYDPADKNFVFALRDRWASYYGGDLAVVSLELKRHRDNWFDETLLTKEVSFAAADAYKVAFAGWASEMNPKPEAGKKYYVKWRFKRVGRVSKDRWQKSWESDRAAFEAGAAPALLASLDPFAAGRGNACWFQRIERNECVYRCRDGSLLRRPLREPDPWDRDRDTILCPQLVVPF